METILSIAGKPGLYKLVSRSKVNLIVEALDDTHRRQPAFASDRVTSLGDIAMSIIRNVMATNYTIISPKYSPTMIAIVCTTVISRNSSSGITFL